MTAKGSLSALEFWRRRRDELTTSIPERIRTGKLSFGQYLTAATDALQMVTGLVAELEASSR